MLEDFTAKVTVFEASVKVHLGAAKIEIAG